MKQFFITGTDTNCGKTYITVELLKQLPNAQALKPIASGAIGQRGCLLNEDILKLQAQNTDSQMPVNQWLFEAPIAPHLAAAQQQIIINATAIYRFCQQPIFNQFDTLLIEGAGGLCVPLNDDETWIDFLKLSQIPIILVVGMKLGCINHALLTEAVLKEKKLPFMGWIANCLDPAMLVLNENIETLQQMMTTPLLGIADYGKSLVLNSLFKPF